MTLRRRAELAPVIRRLERDLIEWAEDEALRLVWADLLQLDGDPLGELVVLDHMAGRSTGAAAKAARQRAETLRDHLGARLWRGVAHRQPGVHLRWRQGFVHEVRIAVDEIPSSGDEPRAIVNRRLARLFAEPALRFVEVVRVEVDGGIVDGWGDWLVLDGFGCPRPIRSATLREVYVGRPTTVVERPTGAWEAGRGPRTLPRRDWVDVVRRCRRLRWLVDAGELVRLPCVEGSGDTKVNAVRKLASRPTTSANRAALARALWDASTKVHGAAFETVVALRDAAGFVVEDLEWFLRRPLTRKDPRPAQAMLALAAIGAATATVFERALDRWDVLADPEARGVALLRWARALGPCARAALPAIEGLARTDGERPPAVRAAARSARDAILNG